MNFKIFVSCHCQLLIVVSWTFSLFSWRHDHNRQTDGQTMPLIKLRVEKRKNERFRYFSVCLCVGWELGCGWRLDAPALLPATILWPRITRSSRLRIWRRYLRKENMNSDIGGIVIVTWILRWLSDCWPSSLCQHVCRFDNLVQTGIWWFIQRRHA